MAQYTTVATLHLTAGTLSDRIMVSRVDENGAVSWALELPVANCNERRIVPITLAEAHVIATMRAVPPRES